MIRRVVAAIAAVAITVVVALWFVPLDYFAWHNPRSTDAIFTDEVTNIAHRGGAALAPENTMAAFDLSAEIRVGVELDVAQCATGELVVIHDEDLDRTTNGTGPVAEAALADLKGLDAGSHFSPDFAGEPIPTLAQVLERHGGQMLLDIDIKPAKPPEPLAIAISELVSNAGIEDKVVVTSFDPYVLEQVRLNDPAILRGQILESFEDSDLAWYEKIILRNQLLNHRSQPDFLVVHHLLVTPHFLARQQRRGYRVFAWTVNERPRMVELVQMGIDGIITDRPNVLSELLNNDPSAN